MRSIRILAIALFAALAAACNIYFDDSGRRSYPDAGSDVPPDAGHVPDGAVDGGLPFPDAPPSDGGCNGTDGGAFPDAAEPPVDGGSAPDGHCC